MMVAMMAEHRKDLDRDGHRAGFLQDADERLERDRNYGVGEIVF